MSSPFLGEIRMAGFNFAPVGWAMCNGQLLTIAENDALLLRVAGEPSLRYWSQRLQELGISPEQLVQRDGRATLDFHDSEGQRFRLVADNRDAPSHPWDKRSVILLFAWRRQ